MWWSSPSAVIFFNGASKGNLGVSSVGGLVLSLDRLSTFRLYWGLGIMTNNQPIGYSLLMATQLAKEKAFQAVLIYGDTELLINSLNSSVSLSNFALNAILQRIKRNLKAFPRIKVVHILRELNKPSDALANKACCLSLRFLSINEETSSFHSIP